MKKLGIFFFILFASITFIYSGEVTLGFGWRSSSNGMVLGELSLPISVKNTHEDDYGIQTYTYDYSLKSDINSFSRRGYFVFGMDFFLYKKQLSLGFELNAGLIMRDITMFSSYKYEPKNEYDQPMTDEYTYDDKRIIIPANFFVISKYKFDTIKKSVGWLRPYIGVGGGLNSSIFIEKISIYDENSNDEIGEKDFAYSGAFLVLVGADLFFSKKTGIFIEFRYIKPLSEGRYFRDQAVIGIGFRFI